MNSAAVENLPDTRNNVAATSSVALASNIILLPALLCSLIAVLPVPYLVFKSVYVLSDGDDEASFHQIIKTNSLVFWLLAALATLLATFTVAPFNLYNTYKTVQGIKHHHLSLQLISFRQALTLALRVLAFSFGFVNGYNMALAYNDVIVSRSIFSKIMRGIFVAIATLFAGIDSRIVFEKFQQEAPQDWRYAKRLANIMMRKISALEVEQHGEVDRLIASESTQLSVEQCDDHKQIILYAKAPKELLANKNLINAPENLTFRAYLVFVQANEFPLWRYLGGDVFGGVFALMLSIFNAFNTWNYAREATLGFFEYIGLSRGSAALGVTATCVSFISSAVSTFMSFYLIRDLFCRELFKKFDCENVFKKLAIKIGTLIPAFCFALLNVALTFMNKSLSPTVKLIVSMSAVLGATTVLRYGIEGVFEEWRGKHDLRKEFVRLPDYFCGSCFFSSDEGGQNKATSNKKWCCVW